MSFRPLEKLMINKDAPAIGIDWGSTGFRAYLFDQNQFQLIDSITSDRGIKHVPSDQFEQTLFEQIGHWVQPGACILLSGMISSRNGWVETPYLPIPTHLDGLLDQARILKTRDATLLFLPGLSQSEPRPDVIRGEELQLFGASDQLPDATMILPGTHSKWAQVRKQQVIHFQTIVTGELFDVLLHNTLVGQLAKGKGHFEEAFNKGVLKGFNSAAIISELFQCRSGVLLEALDAEHIYSYLSGMLIGNEIKAAMTMRELDALNTPIAVIGTSKLCGLYDTALKILGFDTTTLENDLSAKAFAKLLGEYIQNRSA